MSHAVCVLATWVSYAKTTELVQISTGGALLSGTCQPILTDLCMSAMYIVSHVTVGKCSYTVHIPVKRISYLDKLVMQPSAKLLETLVIIIIIITVDVS